MEKEGKDALEMDKEKKKKDEKGAEEESRRAVESRSGCARMRVVRKMYLKKNCTALGSAEEGFLIVPKPTRPKPV